MLTGSQQLAPE